MQSSEVSSFYELYEFAEGDHKKDEKVDSQLEGLANISGTNGKVGGNHWDGKESPWKWDFVIVPWRKKEEVQKVKNMLSPTYPR